MLDLNLLKTFTVIAETGSSAVRQAGSASPRPPSASGQTARTPPRSTTSGANRPRRHSHPKRLAPAGTRRADSSLSRRGACRAIRGIGLSGTIRFGCPDDYAVCFLPQLLRGFAREHPEVIVEVHSAHTPRLLERLERHSLDLALTSFGLGERASIIRTCRSCGLAPTASMRPIWIRSGLR